MREGRHEVAPIRRPASCLKRATEGFDYSGRGQSAEPRFQKGECGIFIGSSGTRADIKANSQFEVGYGMLPYWPDVAGAPQNSIIGGATLWVLRDRPRAEYAGVAKFFVYLSRPEIQAAWHQVTGYLPITRAAFDLSRAQGYYDRNPGAAIGIEQLALKPPTMVAMSRVTPISSKMSSMGPRSRTRRETKICDSAA